MAIELLHADNGDAMADLATAGRKFALCYADPPFYTQRVHEMPDGETAFDDRWSSFGAFVASITNSAETAWSLLVPGGSLVVHVDPKTSHYLKVELDHAIGRGNFASEIVWRYRRWPTPQRNFQHIHDVLLRWVKPGADPIWNQLFEPLSPSNIEKHGTGKQRAVWDAGGNRVKSKVDTDELSPGVAMGDVWDIPIVPPSGKERTGYPTQKPEALLERLVLATTRDGDHVLDTHMGSGTTLAVCHRLGRHCVGIDSSEVAHRVARERLEPMLAQRSLFEPAEATP